MESTLEDLFFKFVQIFVSYNILKIGSFFLSKFAITCFANCQKAYKYTFFAMSALCTGNHDLCALVIAHSADKCYLNTNTLKHVSECLRMDDGLMRRAAKEEGKGVVKSSFAMKKLF